jgi:hypothetical protein
VDNDKRPWPSLNGESLDDRVLGLVNIKDLCEPNHSTGHPLATLVIRVSSLVFFVLAKGLETINAWRIQIRNQEVEETLDEAVAGL